MGVFLGAIICVGLLVFSTFQIISIVKSIREKKKNQVIKKEEESSK